MATELQKEIAAKYKKYIIRPPLPTFREICFPEQYKLQKPQEFLGELMAPGGPKALLVKHKIGAGKTCTAIQIATRWRSRGRPLIVMPASLVPGFKGELRSPCSPVPYIGLAEKTRLAQVTPGGKEYRQIIRECNEKIDKDYEILSINGFVNRPADNYPPILIVDEVQDVIGGGSTYNAMLRFVERAPPEMRIVLMSATPLVDSPSEITALMELLRAPGIQTAEQLAELLGASRDIVVSYYGGAPPYTFPKVIRKTVRCQFSHYQAEAYREALGRDKGRADVFYSRSRQRANMIVPGGQLSDMTAYQLGAGLAKYSAKFAIWLRRVAKPGLHFTFCEFTGNGGIKVLCRILKVAGWKSYFKHGPGKWRYVKWTGEETAQQKDEIKAVFNSPANDDASQIKVIIGSGSMKAGVSLARVRYAHIMEPYWNKSYMDQVEGRCVRYCSAKSLPRAERQVTIFYYIGQTAPGDEPEQSVDAYMLARAEQKQAALDVFNKIFKNFAVDKLLFQKYITY